MVSLSGVERVERGMGVRSVTRGWSSRGIIIVNVHVQALMARIIIRYVSQFTRGTKSAKMLFRITSSGTEGLTEDSKVSDAACGPLAGTRVCGRRQSSRSSVSGWCYPAGNALEMHKLSALGRLYLRRRANTREDSTIYRYNYYVQLLCMLSFWVADIEFGRRKHLQRSPSR